MIQNIDVKHYMVQELVSEYATALTALKFAQEKNDRVQAEFWAEQMTKIMYEAKQRDHAAIRAGFNAGNRREAWGGR